MCGLASVTHLETKHQFRKNMENGDKWEVVLPSLVGILKELRALKAKLRSSMENFEIREVQKMIVIKKKCLKKTF